MYTEGIDVEFNGKYYALIVSDERKEYAIGEMVCELARLDIFSLKDILMKIPGFYDKPEKKQMFDVIYSLKDEFKEVYPPVISKMLYVAFLNCARDYFLEDSEEYREECIMNLEALSSGRDITEYAFKDSGYSEPGWHTTGQLLLSMYLEVEIEFRLAMHVFSLFINADDLSKGQKNAYKLVRMSKKDSYLQDIGYKILFYENRFNSVFKIKTMMSLCLFEMAHIYADKIPIVKCRNCGQYFVPKKRSDTLYCGYPAPDNPEKTCKEIGAQKAWLKKEKTDDVTKAYRKVYMRYKMKTNRHPDDAGAQEKMKQLTDGIKEWRQKMAAGKAEKDEFICWLEEFQ